MDNKDQDGNEELIIENCKRCNPYCKVAKKKKKKKHWIVFLFSLWWKVELASGETEYLAETISNQNVELQLGSSWLLTVKFKLRDWT